MGYECPACRFLCSHIAGTPVDGDCHDLLDEYAAGDMSPDDLCAQLTDAYDVDCEDLPLEIVPEAEQ